MNVTCRYASWDVCAEDYSVVAVTTIVCAASYSYFAFLVRFGIEKKTFLYVRWGTFGNVSVVLAQTLIDRFNGEIPVLSPLLGILFLCTTTFVFSTWLHNILDAMFRAFSMTHELEASKWILRSVRAICTTMMVLATVLIIGIVAAGTKCGSWSLALQWFFLIDAILVVSPVFVTYVLVWKFVRAHMKDLELQSVANNSSLDTLQRLKTQIGRTAAVSLVCVIAFVADSARRIASHDHLELQSVANNSSVDPLQRLKTQIGRTAAVSLVCVIAFVVDSARRIASHDPFEVDGACDAFSQAANFFVKLALFCAPLRHTHVLRRRKEDVSNQPTPVQIKKSSGTTNSSRDRNSTGGKLVPSKSQVTTRLSSLQSDSLASEPQKHVAELPRGAEPQKHVAELPRRADPSDSSAESCSASQTQKHVAELPREAEPQKHVAELPRGAETSDSSAERCGA